jgi:hypothetical protein
VPPRALPVKSRLHRCNACNPFRSGGTCTRNLRLMMPRHRIVLRSVLDRRAPRTRTGSHGFADRRIVDFSLRANCNWGSPTGVAPVPPRSQRGVLLLHHGLHLDWRPREDLHLEPSPSHGGMQNSYTSGTNRCSRREPRARFPPGHPGGSPCGGNKCFRVTGRMSVRRNGRCCPNCADLSPASTGR